METTISLHAGAVLRLLDGLVRAVLLGEAHDRVDAGAEEDLDDVGDRLRVVDVAP